MGFKDKKEFSWKVFERGAYWTIYTHVGVFGWKNFYFILRQYGNVLFLRKYKFPDVLLWERKVYNKPDWKALPLGAGVVTPSRIYFARWIDEDVGWIEHKDDVGDYPTFHPILSAGGRKENLQGLASVKKWSATLYRDAYLFHCDVGAHRILVTDLDGGYIGEFGSYGSLHGQFKKPHQCALYWHPVFGDILFVADYGNGRITVWQIESINPFKVNPVAGGIEGLVDDDRPCGVAVWRNQLYIRCYKHKVKEFKINSDLTLEATGNEDSFDSDWVNGLCMYLAKDSNSLVTLVQSYAGEFQASRVNLVTYTITAIENTMEGSVGFRCDALSFGIENSFGFSIRAGHQGVWKGFDLEFEGYAPPPPVVDVDFKFSCSAKHDIRAMIRSFGFKGRVEQRQIIEFIFFSFLGHSNYMFGNVDFSIDMDIIVTEFLTGENIFNFKMIANAPLVYTCHLDTKPIELEGELINSSFVSCSLELPSLEIVIRESPAGSVDLPAIDIFGEIEVPVVGNVGLNLARLQSSGQIVNPFFVGGQAIVPAMKVSGLIYRPDLISGNLIFRALQTNGIGYASLDRLDIHCILNELQMNSEILVNPVLVGECELALFEVRAVERKEISSTEEIYQNDELNVVSAEYPEVEGRELLGVAVNLLNKGITKLANTSNMVIDLGYIDLHKSVINQYLEVFISGKSDQPAIGELIIGDYSYSIDEWVTEGEWRILVGKGLTRRTASNPDKRYIPIKLKLVSGFELKSVVVKAIPVARRGR
ncbi:MAG: hypothetical protein DRH57_00315 [Candidatus Cloacimonadota bacterium]|nr:MAG: hypothetical protein DRH57_00315 [Candidatus Cloacimonadota bacterium]